MQGYSMPELPTGAMPINLVPEEDQKKTLTPETVVLCINRGRRPLRETFDGRHYQIPAGPQTFFAPYGAAKHFQNRLIVPGTRVEGEGGYQSYIGILGIDAPEACEMFSAEEFAEQQARPEGLDRGALDPDRRDVRLIPTSAARASAPGQAAGRRRTTVEGASREDVFSPPVGGSIASATRLADEGGLEPDQAPELAANLEPAPETRTTPRRR